MKTKLKRRFVYNPETNESFWKFPPEVLKGVVEYDRIEREKNERRERGEPSEERELPEPEPERAVDQHEPEREKPHEAGDVGAESDEYEEVEVTESEEEEDQPSKRTKTKEENVEEQPVEFTEDDIEYQY